MPENISQVLEQSYCINAPAGAYVSNYGQTNYQLCPAGTYQSQSGQASCNTVPAGMYAMATAIQLLLTVQSEPIKVLEDPVRVMMRQQEHTCLA